jgi:Spy/CpxP family protein refolding chaperone
MEKFITKVRILTWTVIALIVLNVSILVSAFWFFKHTPNRDFQHREMPLMRGESMVKMFHKKLNLNQKQIDEFEKIHNEMRASTHKFFDKMQVLRMKMLDEIKKPNPDTTILFEYADELGKLHIQMKRQTIENILKTKAICTPAQQDSMAALFVRILQSGDGMPGPPEKFRVHRFHKDDGK